MRLIGAGSILVALLLGRPGCGGNETSATTATATHGPRAPKLVTPEGLTFDSESTLYNHRIRVVDAKGVIGTIAGND